MRTVVVSDDLESLKILGTNRFLVFRGGNVQEMRSELGNNEMLGLRSTVIFLKTLSLGIGRSPEALAFGLVVLPFGTV